MTDEPWPAIGQAVRARREELGLTQVELARRAGVSDTLVRVIENARRTNYRGANLRLLAQALGWPHDAFGRMLAGRPPDEALVERDPRSLEERIAELEAEVARLKAARQPQP